MRPRDVAEIPTATATANAADAASPGAPLLSARGVCKSFGGVRAVDSMDLDVARGEIVGLIGPNGAGKSTFFSCLAGSLRPDAGTVGLAGRDITGHPPHRTSRLGLARTFQAALPFARLTVLENVLVAQPGHPGERLRRALLRHDETPAVEKAREALHFFGITDKADILAGHLSGGQRKLLDLARVWMLRPRVLLLDEPLAGVAPAMRLHILDRLRALRAAGATLLVVEHDMPAVFGLCDRLVVMAQGRLLAAGSPEAVRGDARVREAYLGA